MINGPDDLAYTQAYNDQPGDQSAYYFAQDEAEAAKLGQFYQGSVTPGEASAPWWESLAKYGVTRAIDAHFAPQPITNTSTPGTFAGANGRTFQQGRTAFAADGSGGQTLVLLGLAGLALYAMS